MSPRTTAAGRRRLSRTPAYDRRDRRELTEAVVAVAGILVGTAVAIWAMRPGGLAGRQPIATLLVFVVIAVLVVAGRLLTGPGGRFGDRPLIGWAIAAGVAAVVGIVASLVWPGGVMREGDPPPPPVVPDPVEVPIDPDQLPEDLLEPGAPLAPPDPGEAPPEVPPGGEAPPAP